MPLGQLQGLTPLGGGSGYGRGQPPNADGTDPNAPPQTPQTPQRRPQHGAPSSFQGAPGAPQPSPTFAQMSQQGRARPAPPAPQAPPPSNAQLGGQINQSASQALANPSAYGAPQVQQSMDLLNRQLATQATLGRRQIDETMASRGLYDSTPAGEKYGQLQAQQDQARAQYATQLATQAAQTYGQDRSTALQNALSAQGQQFGQGLSQQQLALQSALGYGNLGVAQQQANTQQTGTLGQLDLGQKQLSQQGSQFDQTFGLQQLQNQQQYGLSQQQLQLAQALGYGNLGVSQQQANTGAQSVANQYALGQGNLSLAQLQNQQQYGLAGRGLDLQQAYQQGQLGLGQNQINAGLTQTQMQIMGGLAGQGLANGQSPSQAWIDYITGNHSSSLGGQPGGQSSQSPYSFGVPFQGTQTINYGGQQYTPQQFQDMQQGGMQQGGFQTSQQGAGANLSRSAPQLQAMMGYQSNQSAAPGNFANQTAAPSGGSSGNSSIFAQDPQHPGSGYTMYNGKPYRIAGTTAAGLGGDGKPKQVTANDSYFLDDGSGNLITGDKVNPADYYNFVNSYAGGR